MKVPLAKNLDHKQLFLGGKVNVNIFQMGDNRTLDKNDKYWIINRYTDSIKANHPKGWGAKQWI